MTPCHLKDLKNAFGNDIPLGGAQLRVQAKVKGTLAFGTWSKVKLTRSGAFSVTAKKNNKLRKIRVQIKYDNRS